MAGTQDQTPDVEYANVAVDVARETLQTLHGHIEAVERKALVALGYPAGLAAFSFDIVGESLWFGWVLFLVLFAIGCGFAWQTVAVQETKLPRLSHLDTLYTWSLENGSGNAIRGLTLHLGEVAEGLKAELDHKANSAEVSQAMALMSAWVVVVMIAIQAFRES